MCIHVSVRERLSLSSSLTMCSLKAERKSENSQNTPKHRNKLLYLHMV